MLRKAGEVHYTDRVQLMNYITQAVALADEAKLEGADRAALLPTILTVLSGKQVQIEAVEVGALGLIGRPQG